MHPARCCIWRAPRARRRSRRCGRACPLARTDRDPAHRPAGRWRDPGPGHTRSPPAHRLRRRASRGYRGLDGRGVGDDRGRCAGIGGVAWPGDPPGNSLVGAVAQSLAEIELTIVTWTADLILPAAIAGLILPVGLVARVAVVHVRKWSAHRRRHTALLALLSRVDPASTGLVWLDHPVPLAYSVSGHGGYVVVTDGPAGCLTEAQWRAVLAHEHAHLRARHHHILGVCQVLVGAFPWIPLFAAAPSALTTLVELAADRAAAIRTDPHSLGSALRTVENRCA